MSRSYYVLLVVVLAVFFLVTLFVRSSSDQVPPAASSPSTVSSKTETLEVAPGVVQRVEVSGSRDEKEASEVPSADARSRVKLSELSLGARGLLRKAAEEVGLKGDIEIDKLSADQFEQSLGHLRKQYSAAEDEVIREQDNALEAARKEKRYKDFAFDKTGSMELEAELAKDDGLYRVPAEGEVEGPDGSPQPYRRVYVVDLARYPGYKYSLEYLTSFKEFLPYLQQQASGIINR